ncbi:ATP binding protein, partial [Rhizopus stolonifer]
PYYAAPEVITNTPYEGPPADLWSCGVILYAMLSGTLPFQASTMPDLIEKIRTASFAKPRLISRNAQDLLKRLLCIDAQKRITAQECLVAPLDVPLIIEEKVPKVTFGKFKNLFSFTKNSRQD